MARVSRGDEAHAGAPAEGAFFDDREHSYLEIENGQVIYHFAIGYPVSVGAVNGMLGILVPGDNHFIVAGPRPDRETAFRLARQWSVIQIGGVVAIRGWEIRTKAFREELEWVVGAPSEADNSPAAAELPAELAVRGIVIDKLTGNQL